MNIQNLENYLNEFLATDPKIEKAISTKTKISADNFLTQQLMKSFQILSKPDNCKEGNHGA